MFMTLSMTPQQRSCMYHYYSWCGEWIYKVWLVSHAFSLIQKYFIFSFNSHNMSAAAVEEKPKVEKKAAAKKPKAKNANASEYPLEV